MTVKVMIVDDSVVVRKTLSTLLAADPDIEVVCCAKDALDAQTFLEQTDFSPDVITLDLEMPIMNGITFLKKLMQKNPIPTVIISSHAKGGQAITIEALEAGAVDFITKPTAKPGSDDFKKLGTNIIQRIKVAAGSHLHKKREQPIVSPPPIYKTHIPQPAGPQKIIGIGASTGGVEHLARIIPFFPANTPAIVIVQHMPAGFTQSFAKRLNKLSTLHVKQAEDGEPISQGSVYIAPGGKKHMAIALQGKRYHIRLFEGEKVSFNRPSVDVLFESIAQVAGQNSACALMTGMGQDGAEGLLQCKQVGGKTVAQNEASCVVYGMPGHAAKIGAADTIVSVEKIPETLLKMLL